MGKRKTQAAIIADVVVSAGISGDTLRKMDRICIDEGLTHSTLVRRALLREIRRIDQEKSMGQAANPNPTLRTPISEEDPNHEYSERY